MEDIDFGPFDEDLWHYERGRSRQRVLGGVVLAALGLVLMVAALILTGRIVLVLLCGWLLLTGMGLLTTGAQRLSRLRIERQLSEL